MGAPPAITELLARSATWLKEKGSSSSRLDAELLLAEVLGMNRVELYVNFEQPLNRAEVDHYRELIRRRGEGEPVAYILGRGFFRNHEFKLDSSVLIPRPETEHVVDAALDILMEGDWQASPTVLDLGTGSGAIAISLAAGFPDAGITATDASQEALDLARQNADAAGVGLRTRFVLSDMFEDLDPVATFDLIVSNPPYISKDEWVVLPRDVREYEPRGALYGGEDGLDFYRVIARQAPQFLKPRGGLVLEIGATQGMAVTKLLAETGKFRAAGVMKDYAEMDRIVVAQRI